MYVKTDKQALHPLTVINSTTSGKEFLNQVSDSWWHVCRYRHLHWSPDIYLHAVQIASLEMMLYSILFMGGFRSDILEPLATTVTDAENMGM